MFQNSFSWLALGWHIHMTFVVVALIGGILLAIWAVKNLQKNKLRNFAVWLVIIGIVGYMLTAIVGTRGWVQMFPGYGPHMNGMMSDVNSEYMFEEMVEHMRLEQ